MSMSSLSELCTICHADSSKYRCPRCKTQTCSLPCYKRHQQRASCSGKRDPAAYLKKSQWATPAGIDQDYNYLKSVERTINGTAQDVEGRGIGVEAAGNKRAARSWNPGGGLQKYLIQNQITVEHAPKGMSRQRTNQTRVTNRGNIMWTVEWVGSGGKRDIQLDCLESKSIDELYNARRKGKQNDEGRGMMPSESHENQHGIKRKRSPYVDRPNMADSELSRKDVNSLERIKAEEDNTYHPKDSAPTSESPTTLSHVSAESSKDLKTERETMDLEQEAPDVGHDGSHSLADAVLKTDTGCIALPPKDVYFYLLRPATKSPSRVLIPLSSKATLTQSLEDQTVQEYPTFYVLEHPPDELPEGFMHDKEYRRMIRQGRDAARLSNNGDGNPDPGQSQSTRAKGGEPAEIDAKGILDMLKRDITI